MASLLAALEFPPVGHLLDWPTIVAGINKPVLIYFFAVITTIVLFAIAGSKRQLVPTGVQNLMESAVGFVENSIIMQTIGPSGMHFLPFLATIFFFVFFSNITEIIPFIQFPANARMAMPAFMAILVWLIYNFLGFKHQGIRYLTNTLFPPGVPGALKPLVAIIELVSTFVVRPFSLAVRLFANMMAGHLLLVTFAVLTHTLITSGNVLVAISPLPFIVLVGLLAFEILVGFLQAFIFSILTAVYIGGAIHPEH
ncbi:MAG: F0F1 ATP synthase subunit A [Acidimicrobiales bacterium]